MLGHLTEKEDVTVTIDADAVSQDDAVLGLLGAYVCDAEREHQHVFRGARIQRGDV